MYIKKISDEKRKFIAKALADGKMTVNTASIFFEVKARTAQNILYQFNETGNTDQKQGGGYKKKKLTNEQILEVQGAIDGYCTITGSLKSHECSIDDLY